PRPKTSAHSPDGRVPDLNLNFPSQLLRQKFAVTISTGCPASRRFCETWELHQHRNRHPRRRHYSTAFAITAPAPARFLISSPGTPCRFCRYSGLLYVTETLPSASSATRAFSGRSMAKLGATTISGVPPFGLPNITTLVGLIFSPTFSASPL